MALGGRASLQICWGGPGLQGGAEARSAPWRGLDDTVSSAALLGPFARFPLRILSTSGPRSAAEDSVAGAIVVAMSSRYRRYGEG